MSRGRLASLNPVGSFRSSCNSALPLGDGLQNSLWSRNGRKRPATRRFNCYNRNRDPPAFTALTLAGSGAASGRSIEKSRVSMAFSA